MTAQEALLLVLIAGAIAALYAPRGVWSGVRETRTEGVSARVAAQVPNPRKVKEEEDVKPAKSARPRSYGGVLPPRSPEAERRLRAQFYADNLAPKSVSVTHTR